ILVGSSFDPTCEPFPGIYVGRVLETLQSHYGLAHLDHASRFANAWLRFLNEPAVQQAMRTLPPSEFTARQSGALAAAYIASSGQVFPLPLFTHSTGHQHDYVPDRFWSAQGILLPHGVHGTVPFLTDANG